MPTSTMVGDAGSGFLFEHGSRGIIFAEEALNVNFKKAARLV